MKVGVVVLFEEDEIDKIEKFLEFVKSLHWKTQLKKVEERTIPIRTKEDSDEKRIDKILNDTAEVLRQHSSYLDTTIAVYKAHIKSFLNEMFKSGKYESITLRDMEQYALRFEKQKRVHLVNLYALAVAVDRLGKQKSIEVLNKLKRHLTRNRYLALYFYSTYTEDLKDNETYFRRYRSAIKAAKMIKLQEETEKLEEAKETKNFFRRLAIDEKNVLDGILR